MLDKPTASRGTRSSSTRAIRDSSSATTAFRQALHVRGIAADAVSRPLAGGDQARDARATRLRSTSTSRRRFSRPRACQRHQTCRAAACCPLLRGRTPADWRTSMYYRYYHDPGDHNTRAHYGVRTRDAQADLLLEEGSVGAVRPGERSARAAQPLRRAGAGGADRDVEARAYEAEAVVRRDDDQLADDQLPNGVDGPVAKLRGK